MTVQTHSVRFMTNDDEVVAVAKPIASGKGRLGLNNHDGFEVSEAWIVDTGCPRDLIGASYLHNIRRSIYDGRVHEFRTAGGRAMSCEHIKLRMAPLDCDITPFVLRESPGVFTGECPGILTVGGRSRLGYSFVWLAGKSPCWITPRGKSIAQRLPRSTVPH